MKARARKLKKAGICTRCATHLAARGKTMCTRCLDKARAESHGRYHQLHPDANAGYQMPAREPTERIKPLPPPEPAAGDDLIPNPFPPNARIICRVNYPLFELSDGGYFIDVPLPPEIAAILERTYTVPPDNDPDCPKEYRGTGLDLRGSALAEYRRIRAMHEAGIFDVMSPEAKAFKG